ncbi:hypothetical protein J6590_069256 [Homalodisca vitripennis]|nr:hypothetical protein J6590_069256 [Homalodisca vitripennis]
MAVQMTTATGISPPISVNDFRTTINGRVGGLLAKSGPLSDHPAKEQADTGQIAALATVDSEMTFPAGPARGTKTPAYRRAARRFPTSWQARAFTAGLLTVNKWVRRPPHLTSFTGLFYSPQFFSWPLSIYKKDHGLRQWLPALILLIRRKKRRHDRDRESGLSNTIFFAIPAPLSVGIALPPFNVFFCGTQLITRSCMQQTATRNLEAGAFILRKNPYIGGLPHASSS